MSFSISVLLSMQMGVMEMEMYYKVKEGARILELSRIPMEEQTLPFHPRWE